jgi:hypothetical protein
MDPEGPLLSANLDAALRAFEFAQARALGDAGLEAAEARYRAAREHQLKLLREAGLEAPASSVDGGDNPQPASTDTSPHASDAASGRLE